MAALDPALPLLRCAGLFDGICHYAGCVCCATKGSALPSLTLTLGSATVQATYFYGSSTNAIKFRYTVASGDADADGVALGSNVTLNGGTIKDAAGNNASLTFTGSTAAGVLVDGRSSQTITFADPGAKSFGTTPTLSATSSSTLAVSFTSSTTSVCTITSGGALTFLAVGTCTINADQAGNASYTAAPTVTRSFQVQASTAVLSRPVPKPVSRELGANVGKSFSVAASEASAGRIDASRCDEDNSCLFVEVVLPGSAKVAVSIFDNLGTPVLAFDRLVSRSDLRKLAPTGDGRWILPVSWNLRGSNGTPVRTGVYLWKIAVESDDGQKLLTVKKLGVRQR